MNYFDLYITFIFAIKIIFLGLAIYKVYIEHIEPKNIKKIEEIKWIKLKENHRSDLVGKILDYEYGS